MIDFGKQPEVPLYQQLCFARTGRRLHYEGTAHVERLGARAPVGSQQRILNDHV
jgi:hypothetical protein